MKSVWVGVWVATVLLLGGRTLVAADVARLSEAERKQVNEWMAQRAEVVIEAHKQENALRQAWADPAYRSPEVDALRARYRQLQQDLVRTQQELQQKVLALPAAQDQARRLEETKRRERELAKKIAEKTGE